MKAFSPKAIVAFLASSGLLLHGCNAQVAITGQTLTVTTGTGTTATTTSLSSTVTTLTTTSLTTSATTNTTTSISTTTTTTSAPPTTSATTLSTTTASTSMTTSSTSSPAPAPTSGNQSGGGGSSSSNSSTAIIVIIVVAGAIVIAGIGIFVFRKFGTAPSTAFKNRLETDFSPANHHRGGENGGGGGGLSSATLAGGQSNYTAGVRSQQSNAKVTLPRQPQQYAKFEENIPLKNTQYANRIPMPVNSNPTYVATQQYPQQQQQGVYYSNMAPIQQQPAVYYTAAPSQQYVQAPLVNGYSNAPTNFQPGLYQQNNPLPPVPQQNGFNSYPDSNHATMNTNYNTIDSVRNSTPSEVSSSSKGEISVSQSGVPKLFS